MESEKPNNIDDILKNDLDKQKDEVSTTIPSAEYEQHLLKIFKPKLDWNLDKLKENREFQKVFLIELGSKSLLIYLLDDNEFVTVIVNNGERKIEKDTTQVHKMAKELMQKKADELNKKLIFSLSTADKKILNWAKGPGQELFQWSKIEEPMDGDKNWDFITSFYPKTSIPLDK